MPRSPTRACPCPGAAPRSPRSHGAADGAACRRGPANPASGTARTGRGLTDLWWRSDYPNRLLSTSQRNCSSLSARCYNMFTYRCRSSLQCGNACWMTIGTRPVVARGRTSRKESWWIGMSCVHSLLVRTFARNPWRCVRYLAVTYISFARQSFKRLALV